MSRQQLAAGVWEKRRLPRRAATPNRTPSTPRPSALISVYAVALIVGRLAASQVPALTEYGNWYVGGASLVTALLIAWMTRTRHAAVHGRWVFVVGLLTAPFFPTIVGITFAKYQPEVYGSVFGIIFAGALLGGATVPRRSGTWHADRAFRRA